MNAIDWECADIHFQKMLKDKNGELSLEQFKQMIPCKNVNSYQLRQSAFSSEIFYNLKFFILAIFC